MVRANVENKRFIWLKRVNNLERLYESGLVELISSGDLTPQAIICFGSYARGDDTEQSDIDLAIINGRQSVISTEKVEKVLKSVHSVHHDGKGK
ncbi:MAG: nucleotidyltransferase domain-containing protein [Nanoarchaeota archaeon]